MHLPDETCNVDINKCGHEVLAVESVHDAAMTRDSVGKILEQKTTMCVCVFRIKYRNVPDITNNATEDVGVSFITTLILKALLKPLAKKPPNGPTMEAKLERAMLWIWKG